MKVKSSRFECSAFRAEDEPRAPGPDVVFLGRSNVGKSSLINRLLGVKGLARTLSLPGRTQSVNFYRVNESFHFVDLPGYGYARVPEPVQRTWKGMIEGFLGRRQQRIGLAVLVVDARRDPTELDRTMRDWLASRSIPYVVAVTKCDKLSGNELAKSEAALRRVFGSNGESEGPILVSAQTGRGMGELWKRIESALLEAGKRQQVEAWTSES